MNKLRKILFPFSVAYDGITSLRNYMYNKGCLEITAFDVPVICVGNLNVGGTGKSPMIEYLISILKKEHKVAVLSRGYKRKSKGFQFVEKHHTVEEVGDEPLQFKLKYPDVIVAVDANRRNGINILKEKASVILLDDAFQHRKVKPFYTILLTSYSDLYVNDLLLPAGNLRESKAGAKRANCIVVTKCPENLAYAEQQQIQFDLNLELHQHIYFSAIAYASVIQGVKETKHIEYLTEKIFKLVTGIANPKPLVDYLTEMKLNFEHLEFADHHAFTEDEIAALDSETIILTTEKDFMRLKDKIKTAALFYLPISVSFLNKEEGFIKRIKNAAAFIAEENEEEKNKN
ncbi:MAG: tetraacyldisaccharide 4'-kinase [Flavobacteriaceae bacterium]